MAEESKDVRPSGSGPVGRWFPTASTFVGVARSVARTNCRTRLVVAVFGKDRRRGFAEERLDPAYRMGPGRSSDRSESVGWWARN